MRVQGKILGALGMTTFALTAFAQEQPNVILFVADDLGYGSVNCNGADPALVRTPSINSLAEDGVRFTSAYTAASVSSPTRYSIITGNFPFRSGMEFGVVGPFGSLLADHTKDAIGDLFKANGYATAHIGKWHGGYGDLPQMDSTYKAYTGKLSPGPLDLGFDYHFGVPQNHGDNWGVYIENDMIYGLRTDQVEPFSRSYYRRPYIGFDAPQRVNDQVMGDLTDRAIGWIKQQDRDKPFFLMFASVSAHHPITPSEVTRGTSNCGPYGDFIQDIDYTLSELINTLEYMGIRDNTIIIFTSDNGGKLPASAETPERRAADIYGLKLNGDLRGDKHSHYEGGYRVPFLVSWPGKTVAGKVSDHPVSTADFFATFSEILDTPMPTGEGVAADSHSFAGELFEGQSADDRAPIIACDVNGVSSIIDGEWKYIYEVLPASMPQETKDRLNKNGWMNDLPALYNLKDDISETTNLVAKDPKKAAQMRAKLVDILGSKSTR